MPSESLMDFILSCLEKTIFQCIRGNVVRLRWIVSNNTGYFEK